MNLYLIGYRGSGKTTVARQVAMELNRELLDTDHELERQTGRSIAEIFQQQGEPRFRLLEKQLVHCFRADQNRVVSLGGGTVLDPDNRHWLRQTGKLVWLQAAPLTLWERIAADPNTQRQRPALTTPDTSSNSRDSNAGVGGGLSEIETVLQQRAPIYAECSDFSIQVDRLTPAQVALAVIEWWRKSAGGL